MKYFVIGLLFWASTPVYSAAPTSFRVAHPIAWMHQLPTGEMPGWDTSAWFQFELSHGNIWNAPIDLLNKNNNDSLYYTADFEQTTAFLELGFALTEWLALSIELPVSYRGGGFLDQIIDSFHIIIGSDRFSRPDFDRHQSNFETSANNTTYLSENSASGFSNVKYKLKLWWWDWGSNKACPCGFSTAIHLKQPLTSYKLGLSSGRFDYSLAWHLGLPIGEEGALWISSAATYASSNPALRGWPRRKWNQMYEISTDIGFSDNWGLLLLVRMESPILNKEHLSIIDTGETNQQQLASRIASGWNSLVHWRGSQGLGFRYRFSPTSQINTIITEDWALGQFDERGDRLYTNNAPDVSFVVQYNTSF